MADSDSHSKSSEQEQGYSTSELLSSAKLVAEAAQSTFRNESDKVDKAKAADAAGDLLDAASHYGKLDDQKGLGQYVDKAADYLHQYQSKTTTTTTTNPPSSEPSKLADESQGDAHHNSGSGGGFGDFAKLAGGFLKKN